MAGPSRGLLALVLLLSVFGVQSDDGQPRWSQRSSRSSGGWIPIEAPCLTCRAAAEAAADMELQATSDFASAPVKTAPAVAIKDTEFLRPPPAPVRVLRQEASRPILDTYIENQRPPPPPINQPAGIKQGRDHRFLYTQNPPRQQFQGFPHENQQQQIQQQIQHQRVVFPTHQAPVQTQGLGQNIQPTRQSNPFQQFQQQAQALQQQSLAQHTLPHQPLQHQQLQQQSLQQQSLQQQSLRPQKQIRLQGVPHDQFPLILPPTGLGQPHGFQNPQLQILPVPHPPQPTAAQVNLQNILQQQLQNQFHHQINQQLLGSPLTSPFPPSAIGQQLDFHTINNPLAQVNVQLVPQQQQVLQPVKPSLPPAQKIETTPPPKPSITTFKTIQADAPRNPPPQEKQLNKFQANPDEDVQEEVQLLYVPVEALRQRDRINKQALQNQHSAVVRQKQKSTPERQVAHSFEIKHFQNPGVKQFSNQNLGVSQEGNSGTQVTNGVGRPTETDNFKASQGEETIVREEKLLSFTPPRMQQFHENGAFRQQTQTLYPTRQLQQQNQEKFRFQSVEQLQQEEQQSAIRQQSQNNHRPINQQFYRQPPASHEENGQRFYQDVRQESSPTSPPQTTSSPISTSPSPTYTTTAQPSSSASPAPYQPPLSVYMEDVEGNGPNKLSVDDVLRSLNGAKSVPVLERAGPNPPKVFVGPSVLRPPSGYAKFELPYLSMLDSNRVERKVDRLPFFVAPLSFQPPSGYAKIPFPAPHVGSVVVSSTPIASTTERVLPSQQSPQPSALIDLVNSLQSSNISPPEIQNAPSIDSLAPTRGPAVPTRVPVIPYSSTQPPRSQYDQIQQTYQQFTPQQPIYHQQEYQQRPQHIENENNNQHQAAVHPQLINEQNTHEIIPQQQHLPAQPHAFNYHSTPIPSPSPSFYSVPITPPTTTTTTTTTTALPQTRAPAHHSRGRTRQRPTYTQTTSSDSDSNYRNRGAYRGNAASDTTRQPSTRTRRPWDGRRRPSTTTPEPNGSQETYSFDNQNQNFSPVQTVNGITSSTPSTTEPGRDAYLAQNIRESSPAAAHQQYSNDEVFTPASQPATGIDESHLRNQGALVLSAFQQPQVLGDVITGQIQRPDDNNGLRTYYGGQREYTVSTFEPSPSLSVSPTLPQVQSPGPITDQHTVYKESFDSELQYKEQPRQPLKNKDSERGSSFGGQKSEVYSNYQQSRGQKHFSQQNFRETEAPTVQVQQNYPEGGASFTQSPYVEQELSNPSGQRGHTGNSGRFRNYNQKPNSLKEQNRNQPNVYSTQFTPSIEISEAPILQQSTPQPDISGVHGSQQPQYFIISTPIPNPVHGVNRSYVNQQSFESQQPLLYSQVNQSPYTEKENGPVAVLVNEGLLSEEQGQQESHGNSYKLPDTFAEQFVEETTTQLPKTTQVTTTTQDAAYHVQTQEEPKRTRHRLPQRTFSNSGAQNAPESSNVANEERPRYRGHQSRYSGETRTRQPVQRTRGRHYTTESPAEEEAPAPAQRTQSLHQRFRGRQRASAPSSTLGNSQGSEGLRSQVSQSPAVTERTAYTAQIEQGGETPEFGGNSQYVSELGQTEEQFGKTEKHRPSQSQTTQENAQETERPVHSRGRTRLRGGDRNAIRQRPQYGNINNQESPSTGNTYTRNPAPGQRYQHTPRRNPGQDITYQEPQRDHSDDSQQVVLAFDTPSQKTPLLVSNEEQKSYSPSPISIENYEAKDEKEAIRIIQGAGDFLAPEIQLNQAVVNEQYEQPLLSINAGNEYQEVPTTEVPSTTEVTPAPTVAPKPGRKYGNFVSRVGSPRRQSQVTPSLNSVPSTTPPPDNNSNKVYTVRPARRPVVKPVSTTRIRIRRPTTPPTTTAAATTEPTYFLTTSAPINTQQENPVYETPALGGTRGGFRVRKRPVVGGRRPASPASNEVNHDEQEEEPARLQGGYRQRARVPSRRLSPSSTERTAARWRQTDFSGAEDQQEHDSISQSARGFKTAKGSENSESYVASQNNDDSTKFQISLSEEQLASHIPTKPLRTQEKVQTFDQSPVYQSGEQYYSQQQPQDGQEISLKYHSPPVRPSSFVAQGDTQYTYERARPFSSQPVAQTYDNSPDGVQQKGAYHATQQDFVINFSGANREEESLYPNKDELESGQESRYFDKVKPSKSDKNDKSYLEKEKVKDEAIQEASVEEAVQSEASDDNQGLSTSSETKAVTPQPEEIAKVENKEPTVNEEPAEIVENRPLKKVTGGRRRGNWVRVRTKTIRNRPDTLETAESQNLASVSQNLLQFTTPLKEKPTANWLNTPVPPFENPAVAAEEKQPDPEETPEDDAETDLASTEPNVDSYPDLDLSEVDEEPKEDTAAVKDEPEEEEVFGDLENGDFTPPEKEEPSEDQKEEIPLPIPEELEEVPPAEVVDTDASGKNVSQNQPDGMEKREEVAGEEAYNSEDSEDKVAAVDVEGSTENPEDEYDQQQESVGEKTEELTEETEEESGTDQRTPRVLGTSTTTEISLETEICYRGRCVKTKVDADQVPVE
ncbi:uncharacterized protein [Hetaerina americana]|uniref:uncharacterized protein n=1 Tax=Hetaerina americana TaxID=62018 RepID=UPI003A7F1489